MTFAQGPLFWALVVVALAAVGAVLRARGTNIGLRRRNNELRSERDALQRQRDELHVTHNSLLHRQYAELAEVRKDAEEETKAVLKAAVRTLQGLADEQQVVIEKAQQKYGDDPGILADLMAIDHANSQFGRRAQGVAVLCGGWLGRRETVASVFDVARSAQGRIRHFDRVRINGQVNFSVVSKAVEPVAVVLAELLANATNYSAPGTPVEINIQAVPKGVCLIVDDAGLGMGQEEKDRAAALLAPQAAISVSSLGIPPQFGFAVSGVLAARYGFRVSVDSVSPYGGVRAVVLLPDELLTSDAPAPAPAAVTADVPVSGADVSALPRRQAATPPPTPLFPPTPQPTPSAQPSGTFTTAGGLPKRRRKSPVSVVPSTEPSPARSNEETASRLGAFQRGTRSGRDTTTTEGPEIQ
ncbi:ATP-binding protein [Streptomyces sp. NPDC052052]|uniref:ATP-binding protein n=1 Tax=Streptomyces sp. NPDC052052 TaxID=3154756 RepID=UPI0034430D91